MSDGTGNRIDDYSVASASLQAPIAVGSKPSGFDITPDGQRLYVANTGGTNISVVDLGSRRELTKVNFTSNFSGDTPLSLAISRNGKALFSTTFAGSGFGGRMMSLDLATQTITQATGFFINGTTTEATQLKASGDHAMVGIVAGDISSAPVFVYQASTGQFSNEHDLSGFVSRVAVSADGTLLLVDGRYVLDNALNLLGTIPGSAMSYAAFGPIQRGRISNGVRPHRRPRHRSLPRDRHDCCDCRYDARGGGVERRQSRRVTRWPMARGDHRSRRGV